MNAEIMQFLTELKQNNNREWFQANKNRYDSLRKGFIDEVQQLIDRIALFDPEIAGLEAKDCLFRIYRDIRFSPDKTPYKIHFAAYMASCGGRGSERGGYYIHLEPVVLFKLRQTGNYPSVFRLCFFRDRFCRIFAAAEHGC